jgi:hypothetical protein
MQTLAGLDRLVQCCNMQLHAGCKENRMTVTLPVERKRCAEEELGVSVQSHKKSKVFESLLGSPRLLSNNSPGGSAFNQEGNNGTKVSLIAPIGTSVSFVRYILYAH